MPPSPHFPHPFAYHRLLYHPIICLLGHPDNPSLVSFVTPSPVSFVTPSPSSPRYPSTRLLGHPVSQSPVSFVTSLPHHPSPYHPITQSPVSFVTPLPHHPSPSSPRYPITCLLRHPVNPSPSSPHFPLTCLLRHESLVNRFKTPQPTVNVLQSKPNERLNGNLSKSKQDINRMINRRYPDTYY